MTKIAKLPRVKMLRMLTCPHCANKIELEGTRTVGLADEIVDYLKAAEFAVKRSEIFTAFPLRSPKHIGNLIGILAREGRIAQAAYGYWSSVKEEIENE